jgi:DNA helicase-2/ATP-dependent DNA helicase PcrA
MSTLVIDNSLKILEGLNDNQTKAAKHINGPCFVTAGPGSGKTATVVRRTAYMISQGVNPENVCLFTFTNKAAREMKERIIGFIGEEANKITMGTYHSVCCKLLRRYAKHIGFTSNFTILDSQESLKIIKKYAKEYNIEAKDAVSGISDFKKRLLTPSAAMLSTTDELKKQNANIYQKYEDELKRQNAMDFDNLIINTIRLLEQNPQIKQAVNNQWKYIVADEYHDSSKCDLKLIELLGGEAENVCMILDPDQSIYAFRGANIEAVMEFRHNFNNKVSIFNLAENYRCSKKIVNASKALIANNSVLLKEKFVTPARDFEGAPIIVKQCTYPQDEARSIVGLIKAMKSRGNDYKDIAILYRTQTISKDIEQALISSKVPYKIIGGLPFMAKKEIKDILAYARIIANPYDVEAFKRSISTPKRGIGEKSIDKIDDYAIENSTIDKMSIINAAKEIKLKGKAGKSLEQFLTILDELESDKLNLSTCDFIKAIIQKTNYLESIEDDESYEERISNIERLYEIAKDYTDIEDLIANAALDQDTSIEEESGVQLLTMHASKGLEWPCVIIAGCIEGVSPHFRSLGSLKDLEEERRLFYVAATRAKNNLFLTTTKKQMVNRAYVNCSESRFVNEMKDYIVRM